MCRTSFFQASPTLSKKARVEKRRDGHGADGHVLQRTPPQSLGDPSAEEGWLGRWHWQGSLPSDTAYNASPGNLWCITPVRTGVTSTAIHSGSTPAPPLQSPPVAHDSLPSPSDGLPPGGGGVGTMPRVFDCLPLAAPIGLSPLLILILCGPERVLVVSTEPLDDLSCLTTPGIGCPGDGLLPVPLTRCIQMHTPSPCCNPRPPPPGGGGGLQGYFKANCGSLH